MQYNSNDLKYSITADNPHSGKLAQKFEVIKSGQVSGLLLRGLPLQGGRKYLARGWIRGENLKLNKVLTEVYKDNLDYGTRLNNIYATVQVPVREKWSPFEIEFKLPISKLLTSQATPWFWLSRWTKAGAPRTAGRLFSTTSPFTNYRRRKLNENNLLYNGSFELGMAGWRVSYLDWQAKRKLSEDLKNRPP
jgi:hypothetical protein